ncbi:MAG: ankyrin repeat domain-containing protein [Mediterranea sp.]|jgi:ankyrin repeat protein|nr:ankyrin repeat domain-containing protein [Mediterranea sp.]
MDEKLKEGLKDAIACNDVDYLNRNRNLYDIDCRFEDEDNNSLLLYAISDKESLTYRFFIENGADMTLINNEGEGIIHSAVYSGDVLRLNFLLDNYTLNLDVQANDGATALLVALSLNHYDMAKALIEHGANVNIGDINHLTPLHIAAQEGSIEIVSMLVNNNAIIKAKTLKGNYPLALAVNGDHDDIVKYLYGIIYGMPKNTEELL